MTSRLPRRRLTLGFVGVAVMVAALVGCGDKGAAPKSGRVAAQSKPGPGEAAAATTSGPRDEAGAAEAATTPAAPVQAKAPKPSLPPVSVTTRVLPIAVQARAFESVLEAASGTPPYRWRVAEGKLPPGLALEESGRVSGTPSVTGVSEFVIEAADSGTPARTARDDLAIMVLGLGDPAALHLPAPGDLAEVDFSKLPEVPKAAALDLDARLTEIRTKWKAVAQPSDFAQRNFPRFESDVRYAMDQFTRRGEMPKPRETPLTDFEAYHSPADRQREVSPADQAICREFHQLEVDVVAFAQAVHAARQREATVRAGTKTLQGIGELVTRFNTRVDEAFVGWCTRHEEMRQEWETRRRAGWERKGEHPSTSMHDPAGLDGYLRDIERLVQDNPDPAAQVLAAVREGYESRNEALRTRLQAAYKEHERVLWEYRRFLDRREQLASQAKAEGAAKAERAQVLAKADNPLKAIVRVYKPDPTEWEVFVENYSTTTWTNVVVELVAVAHGSGYVREVGEVPPTKDGLVYGTGYAAHLRENGFVPPRKAVCTCDTVRVACFECQREDGQRFNPVRMNIRAIKIRCDQGEAEVPAVEYRPGG